MNDISMGMITSALADRIRIQSDLDKLENGLKSKRQNSIETSAHINEKQIFRYQNRDHLLGSRTEKSSNGDS